MSESDGKKMTVNHQWGSDLRIFSLSLARCGKRDKPTECSRPTRVPRRGPAMRLGYEGQRPGSRYDGAEAWET